MTRLASVRRRIADAAPVWAPLLVLVGGWLYFPWCEQGPDLCLWKALFHRPCVGCGLVRGVCFLVHGHIGRALQFNPASGAVVFAAATCSTRGLLDYFHGRKWGVRYVSDLFHERHNTRLHPTAAVSETESGRG